MKRRTFLRLASGATLASFAGRAAARTVPVVPAVKVAPLAEFPEIGATVPFRSVVLGYEADCLAVRVAAPVNRVTLSARLGDEDVHLRAFDLLCTHAGCTVDLPRELPAKAEQALVCPCHGSGFDALSGRRLFGPASGDLGTLQLEVRGDDVWCLGPPVTSQ